jgi:phosphopantothenoylcysteine decarboxylase/phosphopantothenate--cysteine ligase
MSNILIGITGGIASYKIPILCRLFIKNGHNVKVIMTENAQQFISPLTFEALISDKVYSDEFSSVSNDVMEHIDLADWADCFVIAPATANTIAKIANGIADNLLTSTVLAYNSAKPFLLVPAMNTNMYENAVTQSNLSKLTKLGYIVVEPDTGELACRTEGKGKMPEPEVIYDYVLSQFNQEYKGISFLITAGPTKEDIDPVRYISNRSSGKMGLALAKKAKDKSAKVTAVVGNIDKGLIEDNMIVALSAEEMLSEVKNKIEDIDILIMSAAVADYKVVNYSDTKIKKKDNELILKLQKNPDILKELSSLKKENQVFVGFAAETNDLEKNALEKLKKKNLDMIVANDVSRNDIAFDSDYNEIIIYFADGSKIKTDKMLKSKIAGFILDLAVKIYKKKNAAN